MKACALSSFTTGVCCCWWLQVSAAHQQVNAGNMTAFAAVSSICSDLKVQLSTAAGQQFADILVSLLLLQPRNLGTHVAAAVLAFVDIDVNVDLSAYEQARGQGELGVCTGLTGGAAFQAGLLHTSQRPCILLCMPQTPSAAVRAFIRMHVTNKDSYQGLLVAEDSKNSWMPTSPLGLAAACIVCCAHCLQVLQLRLTGLWGHSLTAHGGRSTPPSFSASVLLWWPVTKWASTTAVQLAY